MSHLDSYALIAYLRDEPAAEEVERLLGEGAAMSALAVAEVVGISSGSGGGASTRSRCSSQAW